MTPQDFPFSTTIAKRWSDLDEFGVINNAVYFTYFEEARIQFFSRFLDWNWQEVGIVVANANIDFRFPLRLQDDPKIFVRCIKIGNSSLVLHNVLATTENDMLKVFAEATFTMVCFDFKQQKTAPITEKVKQQLTALL